MEDFIVKYWPQILALVALAATYARSESRVNYNEKRLDSLEKRQSNLETKQEALDSKLLEKIGEVQKSIARIEGILEANSAKRDIG